MEADGQQDAEQLKLLSIFHYVVGGMLALFAFFPIIHFAIGVAIVSGAFEKAKSNDSSAIFVGWILIVVAGSVMAMGWTLATCTIIAGRKIDQRKNYNFCFVVAAILTTFMPFGTVLGVFTIVVLMRPSVKQAFGIMPEKL